MSSQSKTCPECGHQFVAERRELEHVDGELQEVLRGAPIGGYKKGDVVRDLGFTGNTFVVLDVFKIGRRSKLLVTNITNDLKSAHGFGVGIDEVTFVSRPKASSFREQRQAQTLEDLIAVGQRRGMKNPRGWARHVMAARQAKGQWSSVTR